MTDTTTVDETVSTEKPKTEEATIEEAPVVEEPTVEEPASSPVAPTGAATPAGSDQQGRQMYDVKCSDCGKATQVPFQPSGDRPVYCRDCYMKHKSR